jgi:hypothetical protein
MDPAFRRAFLRDPAEALGPLALSSPERLALSALDRESVIRVGRMADTHRLARIREHLPWVDLTLRPDLRVRLADYLERVPPRLLNRDEALGFCAHIEAMATPEPPYLADLARFEGLRISIAWGLTGVTSWSGSFDYPLAHILAALANPGWPVAPPTPTQVKIRKVPAIPAVTLLW